MRAKVKLSVLSTGQEFLLLVAKMNLKGILVFAPQIIPPNTELLLELKLNAGNPILLKGFVHKVSQDDAAKKGMVIAFLNPSKQTQKSIEQFIEQNQGPTPSPKEQPTSPVIPQSQTIKKPKKPTKSNQKIIEPEKTIIVDNTLPALSLQSPDNSQELQLSTFDEENVHHASRDIGGETKHVQMDTLVRSRKKTKEKNPTSIFYKAFGIVLILVMVVLFFRYGVEFIEKQFDISLMPTQSKSGIQKPLPTVGKPAGSLPITKTSLEAIIVEDQGSFLKVSLIGEGSFESFTSKKLKDPHRIALEFSDVSSSSAQAQTQVNNDPLLRVETNIENETLQVTLFLTTDYFVDFEAKPFPHAVDIFVYRD